jgi:hypothetical protein
LAKTPDGTIRGYGVGETNFITEDPTSELPVIYLFIITLSNQIQTPLQMSSLVSASHLEYFPNARKNICRPEGWLFCDPESVFFSIEDSHRGRTI